MLTKILFAIIFGFGGWFLAINHPSVTSESQNTQYSLYFLFVMCGVGAGFVIGHEMAKFLTKFLSYEYKMLEKYWDLSPFSDDETYLLMDNEGNIRYIVHPYREIQITKRKDVFSIEIVKGSVPYCACYFPITPFFLGLFADLDDDIPNKRAFVLPKETMIKKGRVDTIITTTHKLVLEP